MNDADTIATSAELTQDADQAGTTAVKANSPISISERLQQSIEVLGAYRRIDGVQVRSDRQLHRAAVAILGRLTVTFEALLAEMHSDAVLRAQQDLALAPPRLARSPMPPRTRPQRLERLAQVTNAINVRITAMRQIAGDVDMLAINARLMSAGMGEAGDDFLGFAAEIRRSTKLAQSTTGTDRSRSDQCRERSLRPRVLAYGVRRAPRRHIADNSAAPGRRGRDVQGTRPAGGRRRHSVAARTADIHRQVGGMIVELQLGDITRQRIEHMQTVAGTLCDSLRLHRIAQSEWRTLSPGTVAALLQTGGTLLRRSCAIPPANSTTRLCASRMASARLAADARDIGSLGEHAYGAAISITAASWLSLRKTCAPRKPCSTVCVRARRYGTPGRDVLRIAHRLTGNIDTLRDLEADIRIMGLNTTLKCGRLG